MLGLKLNHVSKRGHRSLEADCYRGFNKDGSVSANNTSKFMISMATAKTRIAFDVICDMQYLINAVIWACSSEKNKLRCVMKRWYTDMNWFDIYWYWSTRWLQMSWHQIGARPSATTQLTHVRVAFQEGMSHIYHHSSLQLINTWTKATSRVEISSTAMISIHAEGWDCETIRTEKQ